MSDPIYIIHVKVSDEWKPLSRSGSPPYVFSSGAEAWRMANICYPDTLTDMRLGGEERVRVTRVSPERFRERFSVQPTPEIPQLLETAL
jgi:hypothetical protein